MAGSNQPADVMGNSASLSSSYQQTFDATYLIWAHQSVI